MSLQQLDLAYRNGDSEAGIELANQLLAANRFDTAEHQRGVDLLRSLAEAGHLQAQWLFGVYHLQVTVEGNTLAAAAHWLSLAASAGLAPALDRLADLHLRGLGAEYSPARAMALQRQLADAGYARAAWELAYLHSLQTDQRAQHAACSAFARACALAYPPAYYSLGLRFALGAGTPRDGAFARALLLRAADGKHPDAREAADELAPVSESGADAERWYALLRSNIEGAYPVLDRLVASSTPVSGALNPAVSQLEEHFLRLGHPALLRDGEGRLAVVAGGDGALCATPSGWKHLSQQPRVAVSRDFVTREERACLIAKVSTSLADASSYYRDSSANDAAEVQYFTGRGCPLSAMMSDAVTRSLERRVVELCQWSVAAVEPGSVICYHPGETYHAHVDYFSDAQIERNRRELGDRGGQRVATFLVCLRAAEDGGETSYGRVGLQVAGEPGMALLHYNVLPDGRPDPLSLHSGEPVLAGEKWLWRTTLRAAALY